ncbi:MAG TPA: nitrate reductase cytochrome c-type subunit, partial [Burkholderiales bacterium]|nr:nitrate reductase cytochrome c-type subunit [Burkholderiales bacterium]
MRDLAIRYWRTVTRPSAYYSLGFLVISGFVAGIIFWGGFNTAMEITNTEQFCIGCHVMRDNVYREIQPTIPHKTDNYQVDRFANKCMTCHARTRVGETQATPISITHYQDRD